MNYTWNVMISWLLLQFLVPAQSSFQEEILVSSSNYMSCGRNTAIRIVDLKVQQYTTSCLETKHCNLTDQQRSAIKTSCNEKRSCTISEIIPDSCVVNDFGHVSVSYSCKETVKSSCTFENGLCDWTIESNDRYTWTLWSGETYEDDTGPDRDHTTASAYGHYMYTMSTYESRLGDESDMLTGWIIPSPKQCLTFWYHMYGDNIQTLKVFQLNNEHTIELWSKSYNQGNKWYFQSLALQDIRRYRIQFKATRGDGYESEIAVDDIFITNTVCKKAIDCTFETGQCGWQTEETPYKWRNWHGNTPSYSTGPDVDHTLGTSAGGYIYLEASDILEGRISNLTSETVYPDGDACFNFWYYMYGWNMGTLNVHFDSENVSTIAWSKSGNIGKRWLLASLNISSSKPYKIVFEGIRGSGSKGDIALDDIVLFPGLCEEAIDCNFETGQCGWQTDETSYKWINWHGETPSFFTGPDVDHTLSTSTGGYIYLEASRIEKGQISRLTSRTVYPDGDACFTFWYYMYGKDMGTLNVYYDFEDVSIIAWSKSGNIAERWLLASLNTSSSKPYKIIFEGICGSGSKGDIALDDIALLPGLCEEALSLDCNFEKGKCYWSTDTDPPYFWKIIAGPTPSSNTGPDNDHTSGLADGHYIYLEGSEVNDGMQSQLTSETISLHGATCFSFWYHMYGENIGTLNVYTEAVNIRKKQLSRNGNQGDAWIFANFTISESEPFRIIFEGTRGDNYKSDIALDDISLLDRSCSGLIKSSQTCNNIDESISLNECSKYYLQVNDMSLLFDREIDSCSGVYQHVQTSTTTLCNDMINSDICTFYLPELIMEDKRCFQSNWLSVEYTCEAVDTSTALPIFASTKGSSEAEEITTYASVASSNDYSSTADELTTYAPFSTSNDDSSAGDTSVTLSVAMKRTSDSATGLVLGLVIGGLFLACVVIVVVVLVKRHIFKSNPREKIRNDFGGNDYIGSQDIALPLTDNHASHMQNKGMYNGSSDTSGHGHSNTNVNAHINNVQHEYTNVGAVSGFVNEKPIQVTSYGRHQDTTFADIHMLNDDEYAIVDPTAETSFNETTDKKTPTADSYMVLDPAQTGFSRQLFSNTPEGYEFAKPVQDTKNKIIDGDQYAISDGVYDHSGNNRHKESEDNIYNHAVDTIYDSGSHKRNEKGREDTYDHFIGLKTEDDYDISTIT